jgi:hypothetical protein
LSVKDVQENVEPAALPESSGAEEAASPGAEPFAAAPPEINDPSGVAAEQSTDSNSDASFPAQEPAGADAGSEFSDFDSVREKAVSNPLGEPPAPSGANLETAVMASASPSETEAQDSLTASEGETVADHAAPAIFEAAVPPVPELLTALPQSQPAVQPAEEAVEKSIHGSIPEPAEHKTQSVVDGGHSPENTDVPSFVEPDAQSPGGLAVAGDDPVTENETVSPAPPQVAAPPANEEDDQGTQGDGRIDPEIIYSIVRKVVLRMSPPVLGSEALEDLARRLTAEVASDLESSSS